MNDMLPLFVCYFERHGGAWRATSPDFPGLEGYGKSSELARQSLARMVLNFYQAARTRGLMIEY